MGTIAKTTADYVIIQESTSVAFGGSVEAVFDLLTAIVGKVMVKHDTLGAPDSNTLIEIYDTEDGINYNHLVQSFEIDDANDPGYSTSITLIGGFKYNIKVTNQDGSDARNVTIYGSKVPSYTVT